MTWSNIIEHKNIDVSNKLIDPFYTEKENAKVNTNIDRPKIAFQIHVRSVKKVDVRTYYY